MEIATRSLAAALATGALLFTLAGSAADPASGTIDDEHSSTEWTGLLLTPNPGGSLVPVVCEEGTPTCDVYRFEVKRSAITEEQDFITVTVDWTDAAGSGSTDIDLYVINEDTGQEVGSGTASGGGHDGTTFPAVNGHYRVNVIPWAAAAQEYSGKVQFEHYEDQGGILGGAGALAPAALLILLLPAAFRRRR